MKRLQGIAGAVLGLIIAVGPFTFLHVCGGGMSGAMGENGSMAMEMPCHGVPKAALITGILILIAGIVIFTASLQKKDRGPLQVNLDIISVGLGVITIGIPTFIIGVCSAAHMHCHAVTRPALIVLGVLVIVFGLVGFFRDIIKK